MLGFVKTQAVSLTDLLARKKWAKAIEVIREDLKSRSHDQRLRMQLADVLKRAGREKEAVPILLELADDFALAGAAAKAIATLKRAQAIAPGEPQIEEHLAYLIAQQKAPTPDPWTRAQQVLAAGAPGAAPSAATPFMGDLEEISDEPAAGAAAAERELEGPEATTTAAGPEPNCVAAPPCVADDVEARAEIAGDCATPEGQLLDGPEGEAGFIDEVMALIDDVVAGRLEAAPGPLTVVPAVNTPLFRDFTADELVEVIRGLELRSFEPGEIILSEGESGECLYLLTTGTVRAYARGPGGRNTQIRLLQEGDFFGEISMLDADGRTATVTAAGHCELLRIDRRTVDEIAAHHPRIWDVIRRFYEQRAGSAEEIAARAAAKPSPA